ncbi:MAG: type II secretion pathway protein GspD [Bacteroidia bacterium]|nr:MAG: type II secretion pathway protein GspD [Bacteroidia bacterium]
MKARYAVAWFLVLVLSVTAEAQVRDEMLLKRAERGKVGIDPNEIVSFKSDVDVAQALASLSEMAMKFTKKPIAFDPQYFAGRKIGVDIVEMPWRTAMETILRTNGLWYQEQEAYFQLVSPQQGTVQTATPTQTTPTGQQPVSQMPQQPFTPLILDSAAAIAKEREVTISAIFLEINTSDLRESGISFSIFRSSANDFNLGVQFQGEGLVSSDIFGITASTAPGQFEVDVETALKIFESNSLGEIIARPQVTVRSGQKGRVQVGEDFSVKQRTISGDVTETFVSTGTILEVTPKVFRYNGMDSIDITLAVERSSLVDIATSRINKTKAESKLLLLNGEENYVGGLFLNEEQVVREGIPILKDLPWWVLGLRYIFGYDRNFVTKKELIVLLRAELVPTLEDRVTQKAKDVIDERLKQGRQEVREKSRMGKN